MLLPKRKVNHGKIHENLKEYERTVLGKEGFKRTITRYS